MGERRKRGRLSRSGDFDRVYRDGRSHANRFLVLYSFPRPSDDDAGEDAAARGLGRAARSAGPCERNAVKRALREAFWGLERGPARPSTTSCSSPARRSQVWSSVRAPPGVDRALRELLAEAGPGRRRNT